MKINSIGEITDRILKLESENDLLDWTINSVKIYQLIRHKIYFAAINANIKITSPAASSKLKLSKIQKIISRTNNFLFYNPLFDTNKSDALIFESSRKKKIDGEFVDPFTFSTKEKIKKEKQTYTIYQSSYFFDRLAKKDKGTKHLDYIYILADIHSQINKTKFDSGQIKQIENFNSSVSETLNVKIDLLNLFGKEISSFNKLSYFFGKLFDNKKPEKIYLVNFCDKAPLISEAKKRNVEVIDIQHGFISDKDIIYHFPNTKENQLDYFPDRFLSWGELWNGNCKMPLTNDRIETIENYSLQKNLKSYTLDKNKFKVLILSQDTITDLILTNVKKLMELNPEFSFYFKPHPNEYSYIENSKLFKELKNFKNFFVVHLNDDLNMHLADSSIVIGVYTTAIIEALYFNCRVFILNLPGAEMMSFMKDKPNVEFYNNFNNTRLSIN